MRSKKKPIIIVEDADVLLPSSGGEMGVLDWEKIWYAIISFPSMSCPQVEQLFRRHLGVAVNMNVNAVERWYSKIGNEHSYP